MSDGTSTLCSRMQYGPQESVEPLLDHFGMRIDVHQLESLDPPSFRRSLDEFEGVGYRRIATELRPNRDRVRDGRGRIERLRLRALWRSRQADLHVSAT